MHSAQIYFQHNKRKERYTKDFERKMEKITRKERACKAAEQN